MEEKKFPTKGMKHLYTLQEGEDYRFWNGRLIVVHPNRPPKIVTSNGAIEITPLTNGDRKEAT